MLNFTFNLASKFSGMGKIYLNIFNFINATLLFRKLLSKEFKEKLFSALDSYWLKHVNDNWYSASEVKIIIGMVAEALSDYKLSAKEIRVIVSYIIFKWDPDLAKTKSADSELLSAIEPSVLKAVNVYRLVNEQLDTIKYVKEISEVMPDNFSEVKLLTYVKDTFLP